MPSLLYFFRSLYCFHSSKAKYLGCIQGLGRRDLESKYGTPDSTGTQRHLYSYYVCLSWVVARTLSSWSNLFVPDTICDIATIHTEVCYVAFRHQRDPATPTHTNHDHPQDSSAIECLLPVARLMPTSFCQTITCHATTSELQIQPSLHHPHTRAASWQVDSSKYSSMQQAAVKCLRSGPYHAAMNQST